MPTEVMSLQGRSRLGPYRLLTRVGEGGFGVVYLGLDEWGRAVAVRALRPLVGLNYPVDVLRQVSGRNVAEFYAADADAGTSYVASRYVPGRPLDDVLTEDGPLGGRPLLLLALGLIDGLGALQEAGVVHGLLGPGTVLMEDDEPVIIDIGVTQTSEGFLAGFGRTWGTAGFTAPELDRQPPSAASDVYAVGALIAYAATGRPPYAGRADAAGLPEPLVGLVAAAMSPDPRQRPTAEQLRDRLENALGGPPHPGPPEPAVPEPRSSVETAAGEVPPRRWRKAHRLIGFELLVLIAVLASIAPVVTATGVIAIIVLLRLADHVGQSAMKRRAAHGHDPWNAVRGVLALPWHVVLALGETVLCLPVAALIAAAGTVPLMLGAEEVRPTATLTVGAGAAVGLFVAASWLGVGGRQLRRATVQLLRAVVPSRMSAILASVALAGGIAGLATVVFAEPQDWWPLSSAPPLDWLPRW